jgi:hypothetical protein
MIHCVIIHITCTCVGKVQSRETFYIVVFRHIRTKNIQFQNDLISQSLTTYIFITAFPVYNEIGLIMVSNLMQHF